MKSCLGSESCLTLLRPHGLYGTPDSSVYGIIPAGIQEWFPFPSPGDPLNSGFEPVSPILAGWIPYYWVTWEVQLKSSVQFSHSVVSDSLWPHELQYSRLPCPSLSPGVSSDSFPLSQWCYLILWHRFLLLPSIFPSIKVFSNESALHIKWPKYWTFRFSISPSNVYSDLISFRMEWLRLLVV